MQSVMLQLSVDAMRFSRRLVLVSCRTDDISVVCRTRRLISIVISRFSCIAMIRKVGKILANTFHARATPRTELD
jgi:hypothetical protein